MARAPKPAKNGHSPSNVSTEAAVKTAAVPSTDPPTLVLSNGIVLKIKSMSQLLQRRAQSQVPRPEPPMWLNEARGEEEPNENDPAYLKALEVYQGDVQLAAGKAAMLMGTEVLSVPDGMFGPEDNEWIEWVTLAGGDPPDVSTKAHRYLAWLEFYAQSTTIDRSMCIYAPLIAASIGEAEVNAAIDSFRRTAFGGNDTDSTDAQHDPDGDQLPDAVPGDGDGVRGTRGSRVPRGNVAAVDEVKPD